MLYQPRYLVLFLFLFILSGCQSNTAGFSSASSESTDSVDSSSPSGSTGTEANSGGGVSPASSGTNRFGDGAVSSCSLQSVSIPVKIIFVVDTSGSNARMTKNRGSYLCDPTFEMCAQPTDPFKRFRSTSIGNFFEMYKAKSNFSWSFTTFSSGEARSFMTNGGQPGFHDRGAMQSALTKFAASTDAGDTPYLSGLASAYDAIAGDPERKLTGASAPIYYIIFLSDGYPTDALTADGNVDTGVVNAKISAILALSPGRVNLSSVYYSTNYDGIAAATMSAMASAGGGHFINANTATTSSININDLIVITQRNCH